MTKRFPADRGWRGLFSSQPAEKAAVDGVDLAIPAGELFGLLGPNGAGKSTLVKILSTLVIPSSGSARVNGFDLSQPAAIRASIGLATSDERSFFWRLSGRQNLEFFAALFGLRGEERRERVERGLEQVGLSENAGRRFRTYSSGMRQRLSIARALLNQPRLLFLDEPSKGLDPIATRQLHELIRTLSTRSGITVLLTTHRLEEAEQLCDRIAVMNLGQIYACGTVPELRSSLRKKDHYTLQVTNLNFELPPNVGHRAGELKITLLDDPQAPPAAPDGEGSPHPAGSAQRAGSAHSEAPSHGAAPSHRAVIEFDADPGDGALDAVIDVLRKENTSIQSIQRQPASLEDIFARLIDIGSNDAAASGVSDTLRHEQQTRENGREDGCHQPSRGKDGPGKNDPGAEGYTQIGPSPAAVPKLQVVWAFLRRDLITEASYRFAFLLQFLSVVFSVAVFYFIAQLLGRAANPFLVEYGGDYFSFVLIGIAFAGYFGVGLSSFANSMRQAQTTGTLEAMLATPAEISTIILSSALWDYLMTTLRVLVYLVLGAVVLGVNLSQANYPAAFLVLLLTVIAFSSLGIIAASFIMVLKRGDPIAWAFGALSSLLGGVYYPVTILPAWLQPLSNLLPITYSLRAMRLALLQGASLAALLPDMLALSLFSALLLPLSLLAFRFAVQRAKQEGSLTHY